MKPKPLASELAFGKVFTDHMLTIDWTRDSGWHDPEIRPFENFSIHPGSKVRFSQPRQRTPPPLPRLPHLLSPFV
jgi:hypothetical protein